MQVIRQHVRGLLPRYAKVRDNSSAFEISQFGLSCFKLSQDGRSYEAKTFNAYVFPEPLAFDGLSTRKFLCDAGEVCCRGLGAVGSVRLGSCAALVPPVATQAEAALATLRFSSGALCVGHSQALSVRELGGQQPLST